nr:hypothetical protein [Tanacetum cinerariifolium]
MYAVTPYDTYSVQALFRGVTYWYQEPRTSDTPDTPPSQDPYEVTVAWWKRRVVVRSSPPSPLMPSGTYVRVEDGTVAEEEAESSVRGTTEIGVNRVTHPVVMDDIAECVREDFPDLVNVDRSLEVMQRGLHVVMQELCDYMVEIPIHRVRVIESVQRDQGHRIMATSQQSAAMSERISTLEQDNVRLRGITMPTATRFEMTQDAINELISKHVEEAIKVYDAARNPKTKTEMENEQQDDNVEANVNNGNNNRNGNGNPNVNNVGFVTVARECTYQDFVKCQSLNFKGAEGVNSHKRTIGVDSAYSMMWKGNDLTAYNHKFQELTLLCTKMVPKEEDQVEKYIRDLLDNIQGNVIAAEPTRLQDAIRIANNLMDQKLKGYTIKNAKNKRRFDNNSRDNHGQQQQPFKRQNVNGQNVPRAYTVKNHVERRGDCKAIVAATPQRALVGNQTGNTWYECGRQGHYRYKCPKLKNQNRRNKTGNKNGNDEAKARAYAIRGGVNPDSNVITGTFLLNNRYVSMLFNSGADRSFVSTTFSALLDVIPSTLDTSYVVELADGRISKTNLILRGFTLGLLGHPFDIDLMLVELDSFDIIVGEIPHDMDVLLRCLILCEDVLGSLTYDTSSDLFARIAKDIGLVEFVLKKFPSDHGDPVMPSRWAAVTLSKNLGGFIFDDTPSYDLVHCNLPGCGFTFLLAVATFFTGSGKLFCHFFIIAVQTPGSGISILLAVGTPSTGSGNLYCQWELSPGSGNALKTPYELLHNKLPDLSFLHVFGALCYPTNASENVGKLQPKADIGIFIGYAPTKKALWIYNRRTRRIVETIHVDFDELTTMASEQSSSGPALNEMNPATISSGLVQKPSSSTPYVPPSRNDWDLLFQPMFDELLNPLPSVDHQAPKVIASIVDVIPPVQANSTGSPSSTTVDQDAPSLIAHMGNDPLFNVPIPEVTSAQSSSMIEAMQEELNEFARLEVWELIPRPDKVMVITLKWIYKVKLDELGEILKNKARLVSQSYRQEEGIDFEESFALSFRLHHDFLAFPFSVRSDHSGSGKNWTSSRNYITASGNLLFSRSTSSGNRSTASGMLKL